MSSPRPFGFSVRTASRPGESYDLRALIVKCSAVGFFALGVAIAQQATSAAPAATSPVRAVTDNGPTAEVLETLTPEQLEYFQHVTTLSNPFFEGRGPGTRGNVLAAEYFEWHFKKLNLTPLFPLIETVDGKEVSTPFGSFRQPFSVAGGNKLKGSTLAAGGATLKQGTQYEIVGASGSGDVTGGLVFVGFGIEKGKGGYNSFAGLEGERPLEGKIAILLRYEPMDDKGNSQWSAGGADSGAGFTDASSLPSKIRSTVERGAAGIILVSPSNANDQRAKVLESMLSARMGARRDIPIAMATPAAMDTLLKAAGTTETVEALLKAANSVGGSRMLGGSVRLAAEIVREKPLTDNVGAVLAGEGPLASQFIIIGGHYDHVGYGFSGSRAPNGAGKIHPGADDNASGSAGVLIVAKLLVADYAKLAGPNRRSIMFVGFSGEELGLLGARHMTRNMPITADQATVMLNMDMIGRVRFNKVDAAGVGSAEGFKELCAPIFEASGLKVRTVPGGQGPSDHASFYASNIPVLHFFTGLHPQYHMPEDVYQLINPVGAMQVVGIVKQLAVVLGNRPEPLKFTPTKGASIIMEEPKADKPDPNVPAATPAPAKPEPARTEPPKAVPAPAAAAANPHGDAAAADPNAGGSGIAGSKVRFGIAPGNYGDDEPGVEVADVFAGTCAADAGILKGDRLMKWNDKTLKSIEDWMPLLTAAKPGDKVEIELMRKGEAKKVTVTLKARDKGDK